jgi:hypothetical protein
MPEFSARVVTGDAAVLVPQQGLAITRRINGGLNGLEDRLQLWERAKKVLA